MFSRNTNHVLDAKQAGEKLAAHLTVTQDDLNDREQENSGVRKELEIMSEMVAFKADKALSFLRFRSSEDGTDSTRMTALKLGTAEPNIVGLSRPKPGNNFQNEEDTRNFEFDSVLDETHNNNHIWHAFLPFTASLHIDHSVLLVLDGPTSAGKSWTLLNGLDPIFLLAGQKMLRLRSAKRKLYLYALEARTDGIWDATTGSKWEKPAQDTRRAPMKYASLSWMTPLTCEIRSHVSATTGRLSPRTRTPRLLEVICSVF